MPEGLDGRPESRGDAPAEEARLPEDPAATTVGTGSFIGVGCLVAVVLFVALALVFRWMGVSW